MKTPSLITSKISGEQAIKILMRMRLLNRDLIIISNEKLHFPLNRPPTEEELQTIVCGLPESKIGEQDFTSKDRKPRSLLEALKDKLPPHLLENLPKSMDIIGSVAIIEVPRELEESKRLVGEAVLKINRNVEVVLGKAGPVAGQIRVRDYEIVAGYGDTETTYREFGCIYRLDPTKVYFSPRLSLERMRIAQNVRSNEMVLDMFAGIGPFSILIAKTTRNVSINAVDINPEAVKYLRHNIVLNKVEKRVTPFLGDVKTIVDLVLKERVDRTIMNLPEHASEYVSTACQAIKPEGGIIHYYSFQKGTNALEQAVTELGQKIREAGRDITEIKASRLVRETAPRMWQVAVDAAIH